MSASRVGAALAARWQAFLDAPRWCWLERPAADLDGILITLIADEVASPDTPRAGDERERAWIACAGVRSGDRALVCPQAAEADAYDRIARAVRGPTPWRAVQRLGKVRWELFDDAGGLALDKGQSGFARSQAAFVRVAETLAGAAVESGALSRIAADTLVRHAAHRERRLMRAARAALVAHLDGRAIGSVLAARVHVEPALYNFLACAGPDRDARAQALRDYPVAVRALVVAGGELVAAARTSASAAPNRPTCPPWLADLRVVAGRHPPLVRTLATRWGVRPQTVRAIASLPVGRLRHVPAASLPAVAILLDCIATPRWPGDAREWQPLRVMADRIAVLREAMREWDPQMESAFRRGGLRRLVAAASARGWAGTFTRHASALRAVTPSRAAEVFSGLQRWLKAIDADRHAVGLALGRTPGAEVLDWCRRWEAAAEAFDELPLLEQYASVADGPEQWPAPIPAFSVGDRHVTPLHSRRALRSEAARLPSRVEGHVAECSDGRRHMFDVRDAAGRRRSVVAIELRESPTRGFVAAIAWHRGTRETPPAPACRTAVRELLSRFDRLPEDTLDALEAARLERVARRRPAPTAHLRRDPFVLGRVLGPALRAPLGLADARFDRRGRDG